LEQLIDLFLWSAMLNLGRQFCQGPVSRRSLLAGALGLTSFGLGDLLRLRAHAAPVPGAESDTSIIFIWLPGGPPHMEMYDMKPDAPADYRGEFRPIPTVVPGLDVCELLPLHAKLADKFTIVRSVAHEFADHGGGHKRFLTGRIPATPVDTVNDNPMVGSIVAKVRERRNLGIPNYVSGTDAGRNGIDVFAFGSAYLGPETHPFSVVGDPSATKFEVQNLSVAKEMEGRLDDRVALLSGFDRIRRQADARGTMHAVDEFNGRALTLLTSDKARHAFDLSQEPKEVRERYGMHPWGQRALMARRLVESGVSFVTMVMENCIAPGQPMPRELVYNWDSHAVNCHIFKDALVRFPVYDRTITALIEDLYRRGLDKKVLLVVTGEFGRTPRVSTSIGTQTGVMQPGRDHWPQAMSFLMSGGGMRTGQVVGSTNSKGEHPKDRPLTPNDLWATVYRHLGIDYNNTSFPDYRGRPMPILPFGDPIAELL
ncbi:MAG TPA: DUF1501 domain-containing protein, partial [Planctomycetaceae bacterium]